MHAARLPTPARSAEGARRRVELLCPRANIVLVVCKAKLNAAFCVVDQYHFATKFATGHRSNSLDALVVPFVSRVKSF